METSPSKVRARRSLQAAVSLTRVGRVGSETLWGSRWVGARRTSFTGDLARVGAGAMVSSTCSAGRLLRGAKGNGVAVKLATCAPGVRSEGMVGRQVASFVEQEEVGGAQGF